jgi:hypothetical protein
MDVMQFTLTHDWLIAHVLVGSFSVSDVGAITIVCGAVAVVLGMLGYEPMTQVYQHYQDWADQRRSLAARQAEQRLAAMANDVVQTLVNQTITAWDWNIDNGSIATSAYPATLDRWLNAIHPDDYPQVREGLKDHLLGRTEWFEAEYRLMDDSNAPRWIESRGKIYAFCDRGTPTRMAGTHRDVTTIMKLRTEIAELSATADPLPEAEDGPPILRIVRPAIDEATSTGRSRSFSSNSNAN